MSESSNIAASLADMAARAPYQPGVIFPAGRDTKGRARSVVLNFQQLNAECDRYAHGLQELGIAQGDRVLLLLRPGIELIAVVFALIKLGAVPVLIDPGMGRSAFLQCVTEARPAAMIGLPVAHLLRLLRRKPFAHVRHTVVVRGSPAPVERLLAQTTLDRVRVEGRGPFAAVDTAAESEAAIAFTSGSTGVPKGVIYQHGMFQAQIALLRDTIGIAPGEVDLALLYVFALFNPALGVTTVIPDMDPTKSAKINPAYVVEAVQTYGVTNAFGSPTIWKRVAPYCIEHGIRLPSLKRVLMAGAPVPPSLIEALQEHVLGPEAEVLTPFGATEAMPLTRMEGREIVAETAPLTEAGKGMCVGTPLPGITVRVIPVTERPIPTWDPALPLPPYEVGEIVVKGPVVTRAYLNRSEETAMAKIREADEIWHRMGDLGYFDDQGRLWFCGRKAHRVQTATGTLYPVLCETIFNHHPDVIRTALVGVGVPGAQRPVLVVEPQPHAFPTTVLERHGFTMELLASGTEHAHTRAIADVLYYPGVFPTDVRHNAKIQREKLAVWAAQQVHQLGKPVPSEPSPPEAQEEAGVASTGTGTGRQRMGDLLGVLGLMAGVGVSIWLLLKRLRPGKDRSQDL